MKEIVSPEKTYSVKLSSFEVSVSHCIDAPAVYRAVGNSLIFFMPGTWSADSVKWVDDSIVEIKTSKYPGRVYCNLFLNLEDRTGVAIAGAQQKSVFKNIFRQLPVRFEGSLTEIRTWLDSK